MAPLLRGVDACPHDLTGHPLLCLREALVVFHSSPYDISETCPRPCVKVVLKIPFLGEEGEIEVEYWKSKKLSQSSVS